MKIMKIIGYLYNMAYGNYDVYVVSSMLYTMISLEKLELDAILKIDVEDSIVEFKNHKEALTICISKIG